MDPRLLVVLAFDTRSGAGARRPVFQQPANPPYVFFKYDGKAWKQIPLSVFPVVFKESNLYVGKPIKAERKGLLTVAKIKEEHRNLEPYLREIVREPLKPGAEGINCPELVRIEGGWGSPGGAKSPIPITPAHPGDKK